MTKKKNSFDLTGLESTTVETRSVDEILGLNPDKEKTINDAPQKVAAPKNAKSNYTPRRKIFIFPTEEDKQLFMDINAAVNSRSSMTLVTLLHAIRDQDMETVRYMMDRYQKYTANKKAASESNT